MPNAPSSLIKSSEPDARWLRVSEDRRFLVRADGAPFSWFADTAWEIFHRLDREDAAYYLEKRTEQGFTLIQSVVLAEFEGIRQPNAYGDCALVKEDPTRLNEAYFRHVDSGRRASVRGPPNRVRRGQPGLLQRTRRAALSLSGPVCGRFRAHLRTPYRLAVPCPRTRGGSQPATGVLAGGAGKPWCVASAERARSPGKPPVSQSNS